MRSILFYYVLLLFLALNHLNKTNFSKLVLHVKSCLFTDRNGFSMRVSLNIICTKKCTHKANWNKMHCCYLYTSLCDKLYITHLLFFKSFLRSSSEKGTLSFSIHLFKFLYYCRFLVLHEYLIPRFKGSASNSEIEIVATCLYVYSFTKCVFDAKIPRNNRKKYAGYICISKKQQEPKSDKLGQ